MHDTEGIAETDAGVRPFGERAARVRFGESLTSALVKAPQQALIVFSLESWPNGRETSGRRFAIARFLALASTGAAPASLRQISSRVGSWAF